MFKLFSHLIILIGNSDVPGPLLQAENAIGDQTTLISNEEECFALQPVDATG